MSNRDDEALAADLALARNFGLKGFTNAPDPTSTAPVHATRPDPDDATADLVLAKEFGLTGFVGEAPDTEGRALTNQAAENPDLQLARAFGLKGFSDTRDVHVAEPTPHDRPPAASTTRPVGPASAVSAPNISAPLTPAPKAATRKTSPAKGRKGENFLRISGSRDALASFEKQLGRPLATMVRGQLSYHHNELPDGSEARLFSISALTAAGLSSLQGEVAPGVTVSTAPADLKQYRAMGYTEASSPAPIQPDLVTALKRIAAK